MQETAAIFHGTPKLVYVTPQATNIRRVQRSIHLHEELTELLFVYQGEGTYICDGYFYPIYPGDFLLYNQGDMHEVQSSSEKEIGTWCFGIVDFQLEGLSPGRMTDPAHGFVRPSSYQFQEINTLCHMVYEAISIEASYGKEMAQHLFLGILLLALHCPADVRNAPQDNHDVLAERMRQYISLHYTEPLTLQSISAALHVSPSYAAHSFKQKAGLSPIQFMINCRIGEAQNLLISSDYSATQISTLVGYDSINHFSAIFKKHVGMAPIQYRKYYLDHMRGKRKQ